MSNQDDLIQNFVKEFRGTEKRILDDFCKAYLAHLILKGFDMKDFNRLQLNCQVVNDNGLLGSKFWFSIDEVN